MHEQRSPDSNKETKVVRRYVEIAALVVAGLFVGTARTEAQQDYSPPSAVVHQSLDDAWWTGPMLAPSAATLPRGHFLIEPYLYDVRAAHSSSLGWLTYVNYGLADRVTVGLIPVGSVSCTAMEVVGSAR